MTPEEIEDQKRVEYYAASVNAWYSSAMEHDKSLLTLSAGGIGLLLTLLTTVGVASAEALVLFLCAITSFLVALIAVLLVFSSNKTHIEDILSNKTATTDLRLRLLDKVTLLSFGLGVIFTAIIGMAAAFQSYSTKEDAMAVDNKGNEQARLVKESFNGAASLQPKPDSQRPAPSTSAPTESATTPTLDTPSASSPETSKSE